MRRLALVQSHSGGHCPPVAADVEAVVGADWHVDFFLPVTIHVTEQEVLRAVGALLPTLVSRRDVLTSRVGQRLRGDTGGQDKREKNQHTKSPPGMLNSPPRRTRGTQRSFRSSVSSVSPVVESLVHRSCPPVLAGAGGMTLHS